MDQQIVSDVFRLALQNIMMLSMPMLLTAMAVGLAVAVFQATTQIQEQTLAFVPKIILVFMMLLFAGPWILQNLVAMFVSILGYIDRVIL